MADTQRNKSALATLFADNTAGDISPQDLRDLMESVHFSFGSLYISTASATTISDANWTKAAGTTTDVNLHRFSGTTALSVNNRLRYDGSPTVHIHAVVQFSTTIASGTNKEIHYGAYHYDDSAASGSILAHSELALVHSSTSIESSAMHFDAMMDTNDYLELHIKNVTDTTNVTVDYGYMFIMGMFM